MIKDKKGFTLIELIIVMAIIGILAVVAVIAIGSKSADARNSRRLADMSTVRTAMALMCSEGVSDDATDTTGTNMFTCDGASAAGVEMELSDCTDTDIAYINFTNIKDPANPGTACTDTADTVDCDYGVSSVNATGEVNPCDYDIYVSMDQTTAYPETADRLHVTEAGMVAVD